VTPTKWHVIRVWCSKLNSPHDKYCICVCPQRHWYYFINSDPPIPKKARDVVLKIEKYLLPFLSHDSFVDTTVLQKSLPRDELTRSWGDKKRYMGVLSPQLQIKLKKTAAAHGVLSPPDLLVVTEE
jgi:hypothetical protein